jgi:hypothetical protein
MNGVSSINSNSIIVYGKYFTIDEQQTLKEFWCNYLTNHYSYGIMWV